MHWLLIILAIVQLIVLFYIAHRVDGAIDLLAKTAITLSAQSNRLERQLDSLRPYQRD